ncbi:MAG: pseudouridine synthase, partial [Candidatus Izemoplasmatales bacterium]
FQKTKANATRFDIITRENRKCSKKAVRTMRLEKMLSGMKYGSRKEIKAALRAGRICVNGEVPRSEQVTIDPLNDQVLFDELPVQYKDNVVLMLYKPTGFVSSNREEGAPAVMELLEEPYSRLKLNIAGRLDKDAEGLLLLVQNGEMLHRIISPAKGVTKRYLVTLAGPIGDITPLEKGVWIEDGKNERFLTKPARVEVVDPTQCVITITEGKYHQVKRMFLSIDNQVESLKRVAIGRLKLDPNLAPGQYRELKIEEIQLIFEIDD